MLIREFEIRAISNAPLLPPDTDDFRRMGLRGTEFRPLIIRQALATTVQPLVARPFVGPRSRQSQQLSEVMASGYRLLDPRRRLDSHQRAILGRVHAQLTDEAIRLGRERRAFDPFRFGESVVGGRDEYSGTGATAFFYSPSLLDCCPAPFEGFLDVDEPGKLRELLSPNRRKISQAISRLSSKSFRSIRLAHLFALACGFIILVGLSALVATVFGRVRGGARPTAGLVASAPAKLPSEGRMAVQTDTVGDSVDGSLHEGFGLSQDQTLEDELTMGQGTLLIMGGQQIAPSDSDPLSIPSVEEDVLRIDSIVPTELLVDALPKPSIPDPVHRDENSGLIRNDRQNERMLLPVVGQVPPFSDICKCRQEVETRAINRIGTELKATSAYRQLAKESTLGSAEAWAAWLSAASVAVQTRRYDEVTEVIREAVVWSEASESEVEDLFLQWLERYLENGLPLRNITGWLDMQLRENLLSGDVAGSKRFHEVMKGLAARTHDDGVLATAQEWRGVLADSARYAEAIARLPAADQVPIDQELAFDAGRYWALVRRDWQKGLPLLARAGDGRLAILAIREAATVDRIDSELAIQLADGLIKEAERSKPFFAESLAIHAHELLLRAAGNEQAKRSILDLRRRAAELRERFPAAGMEGELELREGAVDESIENSAREEV